MKGLMRWAMVVVIAAMAVANFPIPPRIASAALSCTVAATPDGRPVVNPTGPGPGSGKKVGFDNTHAETAGQADWVINGGFSDMSCALAGQGYTVEEMRTYPLTTEAMNAYDVVVFPEANTPFTTAEQQAIEAYVAGGKGVLFVADHYQADRNLNTWDAGEVYNGFRRGHFGQTFTSPYYNYNGVKTTGTYTFNQGTDWLANAFGFRFRFNAFDLSGANFRPGAGADDPGILPADKTYGVTAGVYSVATYAGATMSIVDPTRAMGVVYPNKNSVKRWSSAQANDPVAIYTDTVGTPAGGATTYGGINEGAYVVIAKPGAGKVAAAGDSSLWEDGSPKYRREADGTTKSTHEGWTDSDHDTLGINLINWLATPDAAAGIDAALQQPVTPEPYDVFTIGEPIVEPWSTPAAGYKWYDACTFKAGAYIGTTECTTPPPTTAGWNMTYVPANIYPNNRVAAYLDAGGFTPGSAQTSGIYWYVNAGGTQVASRYNRSTGGWDPVGTGNQTLTADDQGRIQRWEFWNLNATSTTRNLNLRIKVGSTNAYTSPLTPQAGNTGGTYGYLTVEQSLGYSNGLHAALFTRDGNLDTAVGLLAGADTTVTLPPGTYSLEIQDDSGLKRGGISVTIVAGQTVSLAQILTPGGTWSWQNAPANAYPGNTLAVYLSAQGLTPGTAYSNQAYVYLTGGAQVSRRYSRAADQFLDGLTAQDLTADAQGNIARYEFWQLTPTADKTSDYNVRVKVGGSNKDTKVVHQVAAGSFGYLTVEQALGYSDGLHAALFTKSGALDTAVGISKAADTTVTLPAGTYTVEIRKDSEVKKSGITVTIAAGQTVSLTDAMNPSTWAFENVPANIYPGNTLAVTLHAQGLTSGNAYSNKAYVYLTGGAQVSRRYDRTTGQFVDGLVAQSLTADAQGQIQRLEFWQLTPTADTTSDYNVRVKVDDATRETKAIKQVATGNFGYLTVEQTLGYSDGLHAALFTRSGALDTAVGINSDADTTITLPAGTYTLEVRNDSQTKKSGVTVTITAGQTVSLKRLLTPATWGLDYVPANAYPGNKLAAFLNVQNLAPNTDTSTDAYVYLTGGTQVSKRYNRTTGQFVNGLTPQTLTTDADGNIQRWEFWEISPNSNTTADYNIRVRQSGSNKVTKAVKQVAAGSFGYLLVQQSLGYSDGLHAALFTKSGTLDTAVGLTLGGDTTITLPAGTYTLEIRNDAGIALEAVSITIVAGQTNSLLAVLDATPPTITGIAAPAPNAAGWNNGDVTVTFTCEDQESGIASCTEPITLTAEGANQSATGTATDNAGNTASATVSGINIDLTPPVVTISGARAYTADETVVLTCTATDGLSGLTDDPCAGALVSAPAYTFTPGAHEVTVTATDNAGNTTAITVSFSVTVTVDSLTALTNQFVEHKGTANSLTVKLRAGSFNAYRNELAAQSGKQVPAEAAQILDNLAAMMMN